MSDYLKRIEQEINTFHSYGSESVSLDNCDKEPIHLIGHIQSHGILIVSDMNSPIQIIDFISDNTLEHLGIESTRLLGQPLDQLIKPHSLEMLAEAICMPNHTSHTYYDLDIHSQKMHAVQASFHKHKDLLFIELQPFLKESYLSTSFKSNGKDIIADFTSRMLQTYSFNDLAVTLVSFFREQLNYDRVMVYKFDNDGHGEVVAEQKNKGLESFLGLHYPASDIPQFARYLYVQNRCRIISDILSEPVPIKAASSEKNNYELDLRFSNLRSMSPIHIEYLSNMGIKASLTMSIVKDNKLFGMLIMHNYSPIYCDLRAREAINKLSIICSDYVKLLDRIESATGTERNQDIRSLVSMYLFDNEKNTDFEEISEMLCKVFDADGLFVNINNKQLISKGLLYKDIPLMLEQFKKAGLFKSNIYYSHNLSINCQALFQTDKRISGLMLINLPSENTSFILLTRYEKAQLVRWAGRKQEYSPEADGRLHARRSFKEWQELTKDTAAPWDKNDVLNAKNIRAIFIRYLLRMNEKHLAKLVSYDTLTGLPNRFYVCNYLDKKLAQDSKLALLFIDCDRFKTINDSLGHEVGDKVLKIIGERLQALETNDSFAARLGGDEFTMLMPGENPDEIEHMASVIVNAFRTPISFELYNFRVHASVGVAISSSKSDRSSLMRSADMAMYDAKNNGGNSYRFVTDSLMSQAHERLSIEQNLYDALNNEEIINYYQPLVDSETNEVHGFEALCRWVKIDGEIIPPLKFLGVAEETGIIIQVGLKVIDNLIKDLKAFHNLNDSVFVSINFSPRQMLDSKSVDYLLEQVKHHKLDASKIVIELTEESYIEDDTLLIDILNKFKSHKFRIALDDFGSGYSSMKYLASLPLDLVKFDKTLIDKICEDERSYRLLKASKEFADVSGLLSVAEGVETQKQSDYVSQIGIKYQQGFLLGKPSDVKSAIEKLKLK